MTPPGGSQPFFTWRGGWTTSKNKEGGLVNVKVDKTDLRGVEREDRTDERLAPGAGSGRDDKDERRNEQDDRKPAG